MATFCCPQGGHCREVQLLQTEIHFEGLKTFLVEATCSQWKGATPPISPSKFFPHLSIFPDVYNLPKLVSSFSDTKIKEAKASKWKNTLYIITVVIFGR